ncbi:MAG: undecaprenyl/decaprenyl-phosphate alpha-N-acetylglucosaminyl 1-phosphate transferase [Candidatus Daviesbacteria bacterium]|nr:MAG: undecaprenyl/decaprenyl-phosphate alpha-N-acetylglucosaminyl 1-phosphate transferase [Candidatus Daviesbacteria bacterium]
MDLLLIFIITFLITAIITPVVIKLANRFDLVDNPSRRPHPAHIQERIVPRAGGLAIFVGMIAAFLLFLPLEKHLWGIILGMSVLLTLGLIDDKKLHFSPYWRLLGQILAATVVVLSGVGISFITNPLGGIIRLDTIILGFDFWGTHKIILIADLLALVWIVWVMNMINWSKGVDGQMPGIVLVTLTTLGLLSLKLFSQGDPQQLNIAKLSFIGAGAALGMLVFNWHPAKIFPGFSGSTIFGFLIAVIAILSGGKLATAGLVLLVPATDFVYTFFRRILQGHSPVWADRGHLHHHLLNLKLSHQQIALFYMIGGVILGTVALNLNSTQKLFTAVGLGTIILGGILWLNLFGGLSEHSDPDNG